MVYSIIKLFIKLLARKPTKKPTILGWVFLWFSKYCFKCAKVWRLGRHRCPAISAGQLCALEVNYALLRRGFGGRAFASTLLHTLVDCIILSYVPRQCKFYAVCPNSIFTSLHTQRSNKKVCPRVFRIELSLFILYKQDFSRWHHRDVRQLFAL